MPQPPALVQAYRRYLVSEDSAEFVSRVTQQYTEAALIRLLGSNGRERRRAATLALNWVGGRRAEVLVGRALRDSDRGVRLLAMNALPEIWLRVEGDAARRMALIVRHLIDAGRYHDAATAAQRLLQRYPNFPEAQRLLALAKFHQGRIPAARDDYAAVVRGQRYHYEAIVGWGYCLAKLGQEHAALRAFRRALRVCPELEWVRWQARQLARRLS